MVSSSSAFQGVRRVVLGVQQSDGEVMEGRDDFLFTDRSPEQLCALEDKKGQKPVSGRWIRSEVPYHLSYTRTRKESWLAPRWGAGMLSVSRLQYLLEHLSDFLSFGASTDNKTKTKCRTYHLMEESGCQTNHTAPGEVEILN